MDRRSSFLLLVAVLATINVMIYACGRLPIPSAPNSTPTPTATPGCYSATVLPTAQYNLPNPLPSATPFWTPVVAAPTMTAPGLVDSGSHGTVILKSLSDWNTYWADQNIPAPAPPTNFSATMVLVQGSYAFTKVCYTSTNVVIYQSSASGGAAPCTGCLTPGVLYVGTVTPVPTATPVPTPSTLPYGYYLIPISNLPVSFVSTFMFLY
jgi:hypothetical protein